MPCAKPGTIRTVASAPGIYGIYPSRKFVLPKVRALVDFLAEAFLEATWTGGLGAHRSTEAKGPGAAVPAPKGSRKTR